MSIPRRKVVSVIGLSAASFAALLASPVQGDQPRMHSALDALKVAERELDAASHDKGGHRERALRLVRQAIVEVERGIQYDRRH